jgi:hypothetical protein
LFDYVTFAIFFQEAVTQDLRYIMGELITYHLCPQIDNETDSLPSTTAIVSEDMTNSPGV